MGASSASAINMMDTMDDHVYCNSTTATVAATSPSTTVTVTTSATATAQTTVAVAAAASPRAVPKPSVRESSTSDDQYQQSSPSQYSPSPSSPLPSSPQPASPRPSSPVPSSSVPSSPAPSSPVPSMEDETLMMEDDETEPDPPPLYGREEQSNESQAEGEGAAGENEAEAGFVNDVYDYGSQSGNDERLVNPDDSEYDEEDGDDDEEDEDAEDLDNIPSDSGVVTDDQQGDDPGDDNNGSGMAEALVAMNEVKQLQSILLLHLDLIQEQGDQILNKDKMIIRLKDENEVLKHQLELANRRVSLMMMQLQQNGLALPGDVQQQLVMQQPAPKQEGTVSPLTIRSQMENGRMRTIILKSSSSPPFVSSSVADGGPLFGAPCLPIRNPEVSSTVSPAKEELPDEIVLQNDPHQSPFYNVDDDEEDEDGEDNNGEDEEDFRTDNNEVDGEIFLNYSKSDDDESLSPPMNHDYEDQQQQQQQQQQQLQQQQQDEEHDSDDVQVVNDLYLQQQEQQQQQQQQQYMLQQQQQQQHTLQEHFVGMKTEEMDEEEEEGGYQSNGMAEEEDEEEEEEEEDEGATSPAQYVSDDPANYDDTPMVMIDDGAVEVTMETDSPESQQSSQDSRDSQDSQDSQESQAYRQEPQDSSQQGQPEVNVPFVESSTVGGEAATHQHQQPVDDDCKQVIADGKAEIKREQTAESSQGSARGDIKPKGALERMPYAGCSREAPTEGGGENGRDGVGRSRGGNPRMPRQFNPTLHCPSGNSSDGSVAARRNCKPNAAYMVTQKQYVSGSWKDDAVTAEIEKLLSNEAAELEIPSWTVIEDDGDDPAGGCDPPGGGEEEPSVSASEPSRENISDEAYAKRHTKLEIDERRRKKWDVQRIREQKHIERLKKRQLKEQPVEQEAQKAITTLYPTVDTLKYVLVTDDVPVQAFGELIPLLPTNGGFSLPWNQPKPGPSFANPQTSCSTTTSSASTASAGMGHHGPGPSGLGLLLETKTKFIHRLAPSLQAQKQRFTKRIKKDP